MKEKDYEYSPEEEGVEILKERKDVLIERLKDNMAKGYIQLCRVLDIGKNDAEYDFMFDWLNDNGITIRGINSSLSGEIPNYEHIAVKEQSYLTETLTQEEQQEYLNKIKEGDAEARKSFIEHYTRLAMSVASARRLNRFNIPLDDKIQMAMLGLINAVDKFNHRDSNTFIAYAKKRIYFTIVREWYGQNRDAKYLIKTMENVEQLEEFETRFLIKNRRMPTDEEIAKEMEMPLNKVQNIQLWRAQSENVSFDAIQEKRAKIDADYLPDTARVSATGDGYAIDEDGVYIEPQDDELVGRETDEFDTELEVFAREDKRKLKEVLATLKPRERKALALRFRDELTLQEAGSRINRSKDNVRQAEAQALRLLRHPKRSKELKTIYFDGEDYNAKTDVYIDAWGKLSEENQEKSVINTQGKQNVVLPTKTEELEQLIENMRQTTQSKSDEIVRLKKEQEAMALIRLNQELDAQIAQLRSKSLED